jgi:hypothetical protein
MALLLALFGAVRRWRCCSLALAGACSAVAPISKNTPALALVASLALLGAGARSLASLLWRIFGPCWRSLAHDVAFWRSLALLRWLLQQRQRATKSKRFLVRLLDVAFARWRWLLGASLFARWRWRRC